MAEVRLSNITKRFGNNTAVAQINLTIRDKEFLVLVGPSGCGKTTTLRMVAGLEDASEGDIFIGDRRVNDIQPKARDIAMVFQNYALYPHMNVYKNMAFGLQQRKMPKEEIARRVRESAAILGIEELLQRKPKELSGGQRQRVAMGRAIVRQPQVFLFDEPLSNLDAKLRVQMRAELSKLHQKLETTIIYVTHDQVEAMTLADRIVIMEGGRIMQIGTPLEVYNNPANLFVASFIGSPSMNFIDARLVRENDRLCVTAADFHFAVPASLEEKYCHTIGREVVFGIRPEHVLEMSDSHSLLEAASLEAQVEVVEPLGSEVILLVAAGKQQLTAKVDPSTRAAVDQTIRLAFRMDKMHLFDKQTGEVIT